MSAPTPHQPHTCAEREWLIARVAELEAGIRAHWDESTNGITADMRLADARLHRLIFPKD